jgi:hypothetical protein
MFAAYKLSRWLPWKTRDGQDFHFKMPHRVHDELTNRLAGLVRDGVKIGRARVTPQEAIAANRLAMALVLCHGGDMRGFCLDRRGMSREGSHLSANLGLNEWLCRRAREILEFIQFVEREFSFVKWQGWDREAEPFDKTKARRKPTKFRFGSAYLGWLYYAIRKIKFRRNQKVDAQPAGDSLIQEQNIALTESGGATSFTGRGNHLGEEDRDVVLELRPRWMRSGAVPPIQLPMAGLKPS